MANKKPFNKILANRRAIYIALSIAIVLKMIDILEWVIESFFGEYISDTGVKSEIFGFIFSLFVLYLFVRKYSDVEDK